jgi:fermentation-respiration switch protein FrsA (DUF1100 family)
LVFTTIFRHLEKFALIILTVWPVSACTSLLFYPDRITYSTPSEFGLSHQDIFLRTPDRIQLHGWFLPSSVEAKATVYFLHGNAQNISAHIRSVYWLPNKGYNVFMLDYRGYGDSTGNASIPGVVQDIKIGFAWLTHNPKVRNKPILLVGQSLGASLAICVVATQADIKNRLSGIVLDAPVSNFRSLAREKIGGFWLTWPFQYPLSLIVSNDYNPEAVIQNLAPVPLLIMHSDEDQVVPNSHSQRLFRLAGDPKFYRRTRGSHIATFKYEEYRRGVLDFMNETIRHAESNL